MVLNWVKQGCADLDWAGLLTGTRAGLVSSLDSEQGLRGVTDPIVVN